MKKNITALVAALAAMMFTSVAANAGITFSGSADSFSYSGPSNTAWGSPLGVLGNTLFFSGAGFNAASSSSTADDQDHTLQLDIQTLVAGVKVTKIEATAHGSWQLSGQGARVDFEMPITVLDNVTLADISQDSVETPQSFPIEAGVGGVPNEGGSDSFTALNSLDLSNLLGFDREDLTIDLRAHSNALGTDVGGSASLDVTFTELELEFFFIPEPSTLSLLLVGGLALARRRRCSM